MIFNFKDDPNLKADLENLKKTVSTNSTDIWHLKYNFDELSVTLGGIERELNNLESSINNQLISIESRISNLEAEDYSWTKVGLYDSSDVGSYITPPISLSECKEVLLTIYYGSGTIASTINAIDSFKIAPISVSVRDGSTVRTATIKSTSDGKIFINNVENVSSINIYVR